MTAIDTVPAASRFRLAGALRRLAACLAPAAADPDDARARRAFVQDRIACNPGAFSSDLDVQAMMQHYPGQF